MEVPSQKFRLIQLRCHLKPTITAELPNKLAKYKWLAINMNWRLLIQIKF